METNKNNFAKEYNALSKEIEVRDDLVWNFNIPLADELYQITLNTFPELVAQPEGTKRLIKFKAFFRAGELSDFMFQRIYDGEDDRDVDVNTLRVPLSELVPSEKTSNSEIELIYNCFTIAKKMLWNKFPEMSEFSANSLLHMNYWAYKQMLQYTENVQSVLSQK
ncbi:MAG: hypothetical protein PHH37_13490 [Paludibacter sp.]|nr:hypothetical protein [Paludibacter sp.]